MARVRVRYSTFVNLIIFLLCVFIFTILITQPGRYNKDSFDQEDQVSYGPWPRLSCHPLYYGEKIEDANVVCQDESELRYYLRENHDLFDIEPCILYYLKLLSFPQYARGIQQTWWMVENTEYYNRLLKSIIANRYVDGANPETIRQAVRTSADIARKWQDCGQMFDNIPAKRRGFWGDVILCVQEKTGCYKTNYHEW